MKITILGWYGTETIGDRAILAGLLSFFHKSFDKFEIKLGSLYPFFSNRTLNEDYGFYKEIINNDLKIKLFDSKNSAQLNQAIISSDLVVLGGGPLMDLYELFMVEYAFKRAKKLGKKTALLGCGIGPLFQKKFKKSVLEIVKFSDEIILRDTISKNNLKEICNELNYKFENNNINVSYDPAVESVIQFHKTAEKIRSEYIAVNLRGFPSNYSKKTNSSNINNALKEFIGKLADKYVEREIRLIPMHYFHIGSDDRVFLNSINQELGFENIKVENENITLKDTIEIYQNAYINIGMRFHSVVLQTISSGYNYVLDYTEPKKGKIFGFLNDIDTNSFYQNRYIALQQDDIDIDIISNENECFEYNQASIDSALSKYIHVLQKLSI